MNQSDGSVLLVAEGLRKDVSALTQSLLGAMAGFVTDHEESWEPATGEFTEFAIRRIP